jgi:putative Holliday junction resolvase
VIQSWKADFVASEVARLVKEHRVEELVMGFPRNMDGSEGPRAELYRAFAGKLEEVTGMKPVLWDERRTTVEAHNILSEHNYHGKKRKDTVDAVAAGLILEGYLGFLRR